MKQLQLSIFLVCIFQILSNSITGTNHLPNMVGSGGRSGGRPTGCASGMPDHHHHCSREEKETKEGISVLSNILSCDSHMIACMHAHIRSSLSLMMRLENLCLKTKQQSVMR